mmetsp:Transcript_19176/g.52669  ORF Transcript_19176/g.52669 Transcript_19176/m.52669 type:complete len:581 (+) Transcript_19176:317-2059(+)
MVAIHDEANGAHAVPVVELQRIGWLGQTQVEGGLVPVHRGQRRTADIRIDCARAPLYECPLEDRQRHGAMLSARESVAALAVEVPRCAGLEVKGPAVRSGVPVCEAGVCSHRGLAPQQAGPSGSHRCNARWPGVLAQGHGHPPPAQPAMASMSLRVRLLPLPLLLLARERMQRGFKRACQALRPQGLWQAAALAQRSLGCAVSTFQSEDGLDRLRVVHKEREAHDEAGLIAERKARIVRVGLVSAGPARPDHHVETHVILARLHPVCHVHKEARLHGTRAPAITVLVPSTPLNGAVDGVQVAIVAELRHIRGGPAVEGEAVDRVAILAALLRCHGPAVAGHGQLQQHTFAEPEARQREVARDEPPMPVAPHHARARAVAAMTGRRPQEREGGAAAVTAKAGHRRAQGADVKAAEQRPGGEPLGLLTKQQRFWPSGVFTAAAVRHHGLFPGTVCQAPLENAADQRMCIRKCCRVLRYQQPRQGEVIPPWQARVHELNDHAAVLHVNHPPGCVEGVRQVQPHGGQAGVCVHVRPLVIDGHTHFWLYLCWVKGRGDSVGEVVNAGHLHLHEVGVRDYFKQIIR